MPGCSVWMTASTATDEWCSAEKTNARLMPNSAPASAVRRSTSFVTRPPIAYVTAHTSGTDIQNRTDTPTSGGAEISLVIGGPSPQMTTTAAITARRRRSAPARRRRRPAGRPPGQQRRPCSPARPYLRPGAAGPSLVVGAPARHYPCGGACGHTRHGRPRPPAEQPGAPVTAETTTFVAAPDAPFGSVFGPPMAVARFDGAAWSAAEVGAARRRSACTPARTPCTTAARASRASRRTASPTARCGPFRADAHVARLRQSAPACACPCRRPVLVAELIELAIAANADLTPDTAGRAVPAPDAARHGRHDRRRGGTQRDRRSSTCWPAPSASTCRRGR